MRGINVGGRNVIKMDALCSLYVNFGFSKVQSYIQSGNVIFKSERTDSKSIEISISSEIKKSFGIEVYVLVIDVEKLRSILNNNPFRGDTTKNPAFSHITFLSANPNQTLIDKISVKNYAPDEFYFEENVIYLYCPSGYGNTKLNNTFFETKLKLTATTRNLKTSNELLAISEKL